MTDEQFEKFLEEYRDNAENTKFMFASILMNTMRLYDIFWLWLRLTVGEEEANRLRSIHATGEFMCPPPFMGKEQDDNVQ